MLCFLQKWDAPRHGVQEQKAENRQVVELQLWGQAWQALRREQKELVALPRELGEEETAGPWSRSHQGQGHMAQHAEPGHAASESSQSGAQAQSSDGICWRWRPESAPLPLCLWGFLGGYTRITFDSSLFSSNLRIPGLLPLWESGATFSLFWVGSAPSTTPTSNAQTHTHTHRHQVPKDSPESDLGCLFSVPVHRPFAFQSKGPYHVLHTSMNKLPALNCRKKNIPGVASPLWAVAVSLCKETQPRKRSSPLPQGV